MELIAYEDTEADHALTAALESDPGVMSELGGPHTDEEIRETHDRRANELGPDDCWFKIVPEPGGPAVGTIGVWATEHDGERVYEVGWMVLPAHQGKGIATRKLRRGPAFHGPRTRPYPNRCDLGLTASSVKRRSVPHACE